MLKSYWNEKPGFVDVRGSSVNVCDLSISTASQGAAHCLKYSTKVVRSFELGSPAHCIDVLDHGDKELIALGRQDGTAEVHERCTAAAVSILPARQQRNCTSVKFNPAGLLALGLDKVRNDSSLIVHDIHANKDICTFAHSEAVSSLAWMPAASHCILAGLNYRTLKMIDIRADPKANAALSISSKAVYEVTLDPQIPNIFASTCDNNVYIWDCRQASEPLLSLKSSATLHSNKVVRLTFRPDHNGQLAALSNDGTFDLWRLETQLHNESSRVESHNSGK